MLAANIISQVGRLGIYEILYEFDIDLFPALGERGFVSGGFGMVEEPVYRFCEGYAPPFAALPIGEFLVYVFRYR
jgi:hypothetical protein